MTPHVSYAMSYGHEPYWAFYKHVLHIIFTLHVYYLTMHDTTQTVKQSSELAPSIDQPPLKEGLFNYKSRISTYFTVNKAKVSSFVDVVMLCFFLSKVWSWFGFKDDQPSILKTHHVNTLEYCRLGEYTEVCVTDKTSNISR